MREQDIRPADLMGMRTVLESKDIDKVLQKRSAFVTVACPACKSDDNVHSFDKKGFRFVTCTHCETLFVNPRPTADMLSEHYRSSELMAFWNEHIYPKSDATRREKIFIPRVETVIELCRRHGLEGGTLLDVGAGYGTFCEEAQKRKFFENVIALEPGEGLAQSCREKGINTIEDCVENVDLPEGADVITNFELIEHLFNPAEFVNTCASLLRDNGLLILTTPNIKGFDLMLLQDKSDNVTAPNHINYFHPSSLARLVNSCGLEVLEVLTPGRLDADIIHNKVQEGVLDVSDNPFLQEVLVKRWHELAEPFQDFLAEHKLSSHMWLVARKPAK